MKHRLALILCIPLILTPVEGCKTTSTTPAALAPGYLSQTDQQMGEILAGAHNFYTSIQSQVAAGTLTLNATAKLSFNDFATALNAAQTVYLAYHNGTATVDQAQVAVNTVQSKQAALPLPGATK